MLNELAYEKALAKSEERKKIRFCLNNGVCPQCAREDRLKNYSKSPHGFVSIHSYECRACGFMYRWTNK